MSTPPLTANELARLATLHDIVEPEAIPFWPPAPGWFLVALLALLLAVRLAQHVWRRWRRSRYRRSALRRLRPLEAGGSALPAQQTLSEALAILRDCALAMPGEGNQHTFADRAAWAAFLHARLPTPHPFLPEVLLHEAAYWPADRVTPEHAQTVLRFVRAWIKHHRSRL